MRVFVLAVIGFAAGLACSLADELQGAACRGNADCDKSQTCVFTLQQFEQTDAVGTCSTSGSCLPGVQAGCTCDESRYCSGSGLAAVDHPEELDDNGAPLCFCCPSTACAVGQQPVIVALEQGTAQCRCCDMCPEGFVLDEDGNVDDCECVPVDETDTESSSGSSS